MNQNSSSVRFRQYRPTEAHPVLPVHVQRIRTFKERVTDAKGRASEVITEVREWFGSFATPELALGKAMQHGATQLVTQ